MGNTISDMDVAVCLAEHLTKPSQPLRLADLLNLAKNHIPEMRDPDAMVMAKDAIRFGEYHLDAICKYYSEFLPIKKTH